MGHINKKETQSVKDDAAIDNTERFFRKIQKINSKHGMGFTCNLILFVCGLWLQMSLIDVNRAFTGYFSETCVLIVWVVCMLLIDTLFFVNRYTRLQGKDGKWSKELTDVVCRMPFSTERYFAMIGKVFRNHLISVVCVSLWLAVYGIFFTIENTFLIINYDEIEICSDQLDFHGISVEGGIFCLFFCIIVAFSMFVSFALWRNRFLRKIKNGICISEVKQTDKKISRSNKRSKLNKKFVAQWVIIICLYIPVFIMFSALMQMLLQSKIDIDQSREVYCRLGKDSTGIILAMLIGIGYSEFWEVYHEGKKVRYIPLILLGILFIVNCLHLQFDYTCFYEDKIENHQLFYGEKSYGWEEVKSYVVRKRFGYSGVQLVLDMGDAVIPVTSSDFCYSELYFDRYMEDYDSWVSDYIYVNMLVKRLNAIGVPGTMENKDKLLKSAASWQLTKREKQEDPEAAEESESSQKMVRDLIEQMQCITQAGH